MHTVLLIEPSDFKSYPMGGQLTFCRQLATNMCSELHLCGLAGELSKVGKFETMHASNNKLPIFYYSSLPKENAKARLPKRIFYLIEIIRFINIIRRIEAEWVLIQSHELIFVAPFMKKKICTLIPGLTGPSSISKFKIVRAISPIVDRLLFKSIAVLSHKILAASDDEAIQEFRYKYRIKREIRKFPTRVDRTVFYPNEFYDRPADSASPLRLITTGRIHSAKGWELILNVAQQLSDRGISYIVTFVGDGDDRDKLESMACALGVRQNIEVTGNLEPSDVADKLRSSDIFLMGSYAEGWSTSLLEAVSVGLPCVVTKFSSASTLIEEGRNGYICLDRNAENFADLILKSRDIDLRTLRQTSEQISQKYDVNFIGTDLLVELES